MCLVCRVQVLPCLRMPDLLTLSEYEEPLESVWAGLTRLDLSGCRLGDRHPVIATIATLSRWVPACTSVAKFKFMWKSAPKRDE